jgi:hypothetical protein
MAYKIFNVKDLLSEIQYEGQGKLVKDLWNYSR